jgi:hypothetical protein
MTRALVPAAFAAVFVLVATAPAVAVGPDREESELPIALRSSGLAAWERWLETRQYRIGVPVDCSGQGCGGSAESPGGGPSRDREGPNDPGRGSEKP